MDKVYLQNNVKWMYTCFMEFPCTWPVLKKNLQTKRKVKHLSNGTLKREPFLLLFLCTKVSVTLKMIFSFSRLKKKQRFNLWRQKFMASLHARGVEIEEVSFSFLLPCFSCLNCPVLQHCFVQAKTWVIYGNRSLLSHRFVRFTTFHIYSFIIL